MAPANDHSLRGANDEFVVPASAGHPAQWTSTSALLAGRDQAVEARSDSHHSGISHSHYSVSTQRGHVAQLDPGARGYVRPIKDRVALAGDRIELEHERRAIVNL